MAQQQWVTNTLGGYLANPVLSRTIRHAAQPMTRFRQYVKIKESFGSKRGDTVLFDRYANVTDQGGTLIETNTMQETTVLISQGTATVTEYGNAVPYTGKLDALSEFSVRNDITVALRNDQAKVIDAAAGAAFAATKAYYQPLTATTGTHTTNGAWGATSTVNVSIFHIKEVVDFMKDTLLVPKFDGMDYICIATTKFLRGLKDDDEWIDPHKYVDTKALYDGEVGRFYGVRFIEETNYMTNGGTSGTTTGIGAIFGADAVKEIVAVPEEIRAKVGTDYGRSLGLAWYSILGFKEIWDVYADSKIVMVGSL